MVSFIIPVFNEEESLPHFYKELTTILDSLKEDSEIIFVDDGSFDRSLEILKEFRNKDKRVKIYSLRTNQGKAEALTVGFQKSQGDYIVTLDADLQDQPSEISKLLEKVKGEWDLATGWRERRKDSIIRTAPSWIFNKMVSAFRGLKLHDFNSGLKAYKKDAVKSLSLYGGMHRFIPLLLYMDGFRVCEVPVAHSHRRYGKAKYGLSRLWKDFPDMFTMLFLSRYSKSPMHFFGIVGLLLLGVGFVILLYLTVLRIEGETIGNRPLLFLGILFVISGFQIFFTGFLADLINHSARNQSTVDSLLKYESK